MFRCARPILISVLLTVGANAAAQGVPPDDLLEDYLAERELLQVLGAHLRQRLREGPADERVSAAESLGKLYVKMLSDAKDAALRQDLEARSQELLRAVPEAESYDLRINLAKATYVQVEEMVERDRLKMASPAERAEAERILRSVSPTFEDLAIRLHRKVEQLEKKETLAKQEDVEALRAELAELRRLRSLAKYYAGWSTYYSGVLTGQTRLAQKALEDFGAILNAVPGKPASIERMPKDLLRYEHVSRAAIGCALCASMLGNHVEAQRWLDAVQEAEDVPKAVTDQLFTRRLAVAAAGQAWADIDQAVRRRRQPESGQPEQMLTVAEARLLGILSLEAVRQSQLRSGLRTVAERMAQTALGDLVAMGEVGHVLDLVKLYGTAPIGEHGFIVAYVRGLQAFEKAREAHRLAGNAEEPTADAALQNVYHEAAELLAGASRSSDIAHFKNEVSRAVVREGLALFYAGDLVKSAERFEVAAQNAPDAALRRDALWYAIVGLDRAVDAGQRSQVETRDRLATLYLKEFPGTENAAKLLLRQTRSDRLTDAQAVEILLNVPQDSALYEASRRQAARLLYQAFRRVPASERDFAALRFAEVAEQVLKMEQTRALASRDGVGKENAEAVVLHVRQLADALLASTAPDIQRVENAFQVLATVEAFHGLDLTSLGPEMEFRRLQIAVARADEPTIRAHADRLRAVGGAFSGSADRLLYRRALSRWKTAPEDSTLATDVVSYGRRVLDEVEKDGAARSQDAVVSLRDCVAEAACMLFEKGGPTHMRDLAIRLDQTQLEIGLRSVRSLRRLGVLLESAGDLPGARDMWAELLAGNPSGSDSWFEARYHSLRLMAKLTPVEAAHAMQQFRALYPDYGPETWRAKFKELDIPLPVPAPAPGGGGGR